MQNNNLPKLPKETTLDRVFAWYVQGDTYVQLTPVEIEQKTRWEEAWAMLCNYHSPENVVKILVEQKGIKRSTAYNDVNNCMRLFGDIGKSNKDAKRYILYEYSMKCFQLSASRQPPDVDQMNKAILNMIKLGGLDKHDPDLPDFSKLEPSQFTINIPPEILNFLRSLAHKGAINLSQVRDESLKTLDVQHTEIKPDEPGQ